MTSLLLLYNAVPVVDGPWNTPRRRSSGLKKKSLRKVSVSSTTKTGSGLAESSAPELLRRISGSLETRGRTHHSHDTGSAPRPEARRALDFPGPAADVPDGGGESVWGGVGGELRRIADTLVVLRVQQYRGREDYYREEGDTAGILYSVIAMAIFKYIASLFTKAT